MNEPSNSQDDGRALEYVVDAIIELGRTQDKVFVADIQDRVGQRSFGPFLFVPALFELSPLGGVPGVPTMLGLFVIITAVQMMFGRRHFWLPGFIAKRSIKGERIGPALQKIRPVVRLIDKGLRPRLERITKKPWNRIVAGLCVLCAVIVPPLEIFPFVSSGPFSAIALIGLGLMGRDGVFVWLGVIVAAITFVSISFLF